MTLGVVAAKAIGHGLAHAGLKGTGAAGAYLMNTLRQAGIRNTAQLHRVALLDPEVARSLISKMPASPQGVALHNFARVMRRRLIVGLMLVG